MSFMQLYTVWLTVFSISFTFLPLFVVSDWKKRGSADGFSSVNFVLPVFMMSCWFKHGNLTNDNLNMLINGINLCLFAFYIAAFAFYQPKRKYLYGQLTTLIIALFTLFSYVDNKPAEAQPDSMGSIAAAAQVASLAGNVYDLKRAIFDLKTTEYIPASIQFGLFALTIQWSIFALLVGNSYMLVANLAGLAVNLATLATFVAYPPKTWKVPIFGVGGEEKKQK
ncbi:hypothetical protein niasHS_010893 [Heterodera schachtii]|uniref:Sugar transporter SWEET n=1 Tax=Heterodera schachtii TaxID=97005 RepID=A0ABD2IUT9_HETSC